MNWLPKERHYLEVETIGAATLKMRPDMMELPPGGVGEVIKGFRAAQVEALGERGAAMARLGAKPEPRSAPMSALQSKRLQRLGIGTDETEDSPSEIAAPGSTPQAGLQPRPVFGRKVS